MKYFFALFPTIAVVAATAVGTPVIKEASLVQRDLATVTGAVASISDATTKLSTAIDGFNGAGQVAEVQAASQAVIDAIKTGTTNVMGSEVLSQADALTLATPVQSLSDLVSSTVDAVIAKKPAFVSAGVGSVVLDQLNQQLDAAKAFADAVTSKVPEALQSVAASLAAPITAALSKGVSAFQDQAGSGGSGSSSSAGASASSSASTSASTSAGAGAGSTPIASGTAPITTGSSTNATATGSLSTGGGATATTDLTLPSASDFTGAAAPTAAAGFGLAAAAALAAVAVL